MNCNNTNKNPDSLVRCADNSSPVGHTFPVMSIVAIRTEKTILCGPPAMWHFEATVAVSMPGKPEETVYISMCEWEPDMVQITRNSVFSPEFDTNPEYEIDVIESYDTAKDAKSSPYWSVIQTAGKMFRELYKFL